jgi:hypothetical protein
MLANRKALILSTVLQASTVAWGDPTLSQNSRKAEPPKPIASPTPRINYFDLRLPSSREMEEQRPTVGNHETLSAKATPNALNITPASGLHLSQIDQRPALEYHLSDKNTVRFHVGVHGATASTSWGF